jgi:hypothetical protein
VCVRTLKDFCEFADVEYTNILGHTKTWWLSQLPTFKRIVVVYSAIVSWFLSIENSLTSPRKFF